MEIVSLARALDQLGIRQNPRLRLMRTGDSHAVSKPPAWAADTPPAPRT